MPVQPRLRRRAQEHGRSSPVLAMLGGCDAASSTSVAGELTRPRNEAQIYARYRGAFGPVGIAIQGGGIFSGKVDDNSTPQQAVQYDGYSLGDGGGILTYGGLAIGGHITAGRSNGQFSLDPKGGKDSLRGLAVHPMRSVRSSSVPPTSTT